MIITVGTTVRDNDNRSYTLVEPLGSGGFGYVYKAHCNEDGRFVAVKVLQNTFDSDDAYLTFQKEANQAKLLSSKYVIKYHYIHDGKTFPEYPPYIIMEYTEGGTLRDLIEKRNGTQFDISELKSILLQLAEGMQCVSKHLVHRDIKPENILNFNGVLKITDFGLSKISGESTKTMTFKNAGTPLYIAPEAWNGDANTVQMDIYSMGIVFYELATLAYPYKRPDKGDYAAIRDMHLFEPIINPSHSNKALPSNIVSMIIRMMEKPTQKRFNNWTEIIEILESEPLPSDSMSDIVNRAISLRTEKDIERQRISAEKEKAAEIREKHAKLAYSQYKADVSTPIHEFADRFNSQYSSNAKITIKESSPSQYSDRFSTDIHMPNGRHIKVDGEILFEENFSKRERMMFNDTPRTVHYLPQCNGKNIMLWCQVKDFDNIGFNILLLENKSSIYGDWIILENSSNYFSKDRRKSPFGFALTELPEQINYINVMHIYDMNLFPFSIDKILNFIAERI